MERSADWLDQAERDLQHAVQDMETGYYEWACFSAQQSAEKAIKAALKKKGVETWGHSVSDLLDDLNNFTLLPKGLRDKALELDKAYIPTRYPDAHPSGSPRKRYSRIEASRLIDYAREVIALCKSFLSQVQ